MLDYELCKKTRVLEGGYYAIHAWLRSNYGSADHCEGTTCSEESKRFEWALIHGKEHEHKRENYMQLCKKCHTVYDKIHVKEKSYRWRGGRPNCTNCEKQLSIWKVQSKTGLCGTCNRKLNPPWKGKKRGWMSWLNPQPDA